MGLFRPPSLPDVPFPRGRLSRIVGRDGCACFWRLSAHQPFGAKVAASTNSFDDAFTNENGHSISQQLFESKSEVIGYGKGAISIASLGNDFCGIFKDGNLVNVLDAANGSIGAINDLTNMINDGN